MLVEVGRCLEVLGKLGELRRCWGKRGDIDGIQESLRDVRVVRRCQEILEDGEEMLKDFRICYDRLGNFK